MPLLKSPQARPLIKEAVVLDLGDLGRQAAKLRAKAEQDAARILDAAEAEADRLIEAAHAQGYEQGEADGHESGLARGRQAGHAEAISQTTDALTQIQDAWLQAAATFDAERATMEREAQHAVLELAVRLAQRIVHRTIEVQPDAVLDVAAEALSMVMRPLDVSLAIHPDDRPLLDEAMPRLTAGLANVQRVHLIDDPTITRGGCILTHGQGRIDATIDTQLQRIAEALLGSSSPLPPKPKRQAEIAPTSPLPS